MLDTNMNLLATLGSIVPSPVGLGQANGGISQPRFDALLSELTRAASESGKPKDVPQVPEKVQEALKSLLLDLSETSFEEISNLIKSPSDRKSLISQAVQENTLQPQDAEILEQLFQAVLQKVVDVSSPQIAKQIDAQTRVIPGLDPGPQGGTPGNAQSFVSEAANGQLVNASRAATDAPKGKYIEVVRTLASAQEDSTPQANVVAPIANGAAFMPPVVSGNAAPQGPSTVAVTGATVTVPQQLNSTPLPVVPVTPQGANTLGRIVSVAQSPQPGSNQSSPQGETLLAAPNARLAPAPSVPATSPAIPVIDSGAQNFLNQGQTASRAEVSAVTSPRILSAAPSVPAESSSLAQQPVPLGQAQAQPTANNQAASANVSIAPQGAIETNVPPQQRVVIVPVSNNATPPAKGVDAAPTAPPVITGGSKGDVSAPAVVKPLISATEQQPISTAPLTRPLGNEGLGVNRLQVVVQGPQPEPLIVSSSSVILGPQTTSKQAPPALPSASSVPSANPAGTLDVPVSGTNAAAATSAETPGSPAAQVSGNGQPAAVLPQDGSTQQAAQAIPAANNPETQAASSQPRFDAATLGANKQTLSGEEGNRQGVTVNTSQTQGIAIEAPRITAQSIGDLTQSVVKDFQLRETVLKQVAARLDTIEKGVTQLKMQLEPQNLGKLEIALTTHEGRLVARLVASNVEVKEVIAANLQSFQNALENKGIVVQQLSVALRADVSGQNQGHTFDNQAWMFKQANSNQDQLPSSESGWPPDALDLKALGSFSVLV